MIAAVSALCVLAPASAGRALGPPLAAAHEYMADVAAPGEAPVRLHVAESGRGPPVLLLHGIGGSSYSFRHLIPALAAQHRVIALDLKGFGRSEKPLDPAYAAIDQARLVAAFLRQRRLDGVTVIGHSFGGVVALLLALETQRIEPSRIRRLVLLSPPAYPQPIPIVQKFLMLPLVPHIALIAVPPILTARNLLAVRHRASPPANDRDAIAYSDPLYEIGGRHALITTTRLIAAGLGREAIAHYPAIRQPALIVWCRHDQTVPLETGQRLAREMPHARLAVIEGCEHLPAEENPAATWQAMRRFLVR